MRKIALGMVVLAAACGGGSAPANTSPAPSSGTAGASTSAAADPCSSGSCTVRVSVDPQVANEYQRRQVNYKLYQGCPRNNGVSSVSGFRGLPPLLTSTQTTFTVPSTFRGRYGTIVRFEGPTPAQYVVVDFGAGSEAAVNYGQLWTGNSLQTDGVVSNTNSSFERRVCR